MWEGGKCVPPPPGGEKKFAQVSVTKRDLDAANIFVSKPKRDFDAASMADDLLERAARRPPPRPPAFNWTLFRLAIRSSTALASHETVLGSAVPSTATPPAPCCFPIIRSGLQQVRFLRKLMPGEGFYMNVLWCIIKAWK